MPNDSLSLENASAVLGFIRPTFILDQSGRSQAFIKPGFLRFCFFIGCTFSDRLATDSAVLSYLKAFLKTSIKNYIKDIQVISGDSDHIQSSIELAIRFGKTILVENVSTIGPFIFEVLKNKLHTVGTRPSIRLGKNSHDVNAGFKESYPNTHTNSRDKSNIWI